MPETQKATNVRTGESVETPVPTAEEAYAEALLREREGYERRGVDDRVKQVDAELKRIGYTREKAHRGRERAVTSGGRETRGGE